ncbi:MAG TPA: AMP-binding protein [Geminicoccus sp.]|uniref:AMP-binding protein n=1 Tax=Geminicoccus sp. TaxID=2024832 RepID=UPI002E35B805|nr:AMP-binding protein [Geminicoccus sp.]HEX2526215.1 AMP-binding protein [Geminicoccus sp.]
MAASSPIPAPASDPFPAGAVIKDGLYIEHLLAVLREAGTRTVLAHRGQSIPAHAFLGSIYRYARALAEVGIGRGSLVALVAPNRPEALAVRYAAHLLGAGTSYLPVPASAERRADLLAQIDPQLLVLFEETAGLFPRSAAIPVAMIGAGSDQPAHRLDERAAAQPAEPTAVVARPSDLAVIISSGGTTGVPKGSWRTFASYSAMVQVPSPSDRRQLVDGRLAYLSQVLVDLTLLGGGTVVLEDSFDAADTLATIELERITHLFLVEPQLFELMDHPGLDRRNLASLREITHIGASAPPTLRRRAFERLGPVLVHTYGASEMGLVSSLKPAQHDPTHPDTFSCAGHIHPGVAVRFRQPDGRLADAGAYGSIEVCSPAMANGYRNRPALEAGAFQDGWYHTGDLGFLDPRGLLHILGRAADICWIDGRMVSPTLIEDTLCQLPDVRYVVVVAEQDPARWIAAVVPWPGASPQPSAWLSTVAERHGDAVASATTLLTVERVPLTEQGKPDREAIRRLGHETAALLAPAGEGRRPASCGSG